MRMAPVGGLIADEDRSPGRGLSTGGGDAGPDTVRRSACDDRVSGRGHDRKRWDQNRTVAGLRLPRAMTNWPSRDSPRVRAGRSAERYLHVRGVVSPWWILRSARRAARDLFRFAEGHHAVVPQGAGGRAGAFDTGVNARWVSTRVGLAEAGAGGGDPVSMGGGRRSVASLRHRASSRPDASHHDRLMWARAGIPREAVSAPHRRSLRPFSPSASYSGKRHVVCDGGSRPGVGLGRAQAQAQAQAQQQ